MYIYIKYICKKCMCKMQYTSKYLKDYIYGVSDYSAPETGS